MTVKQEKTDFRIKKTNYAIKQAFWKLLASEGLQKMTIKQILATAKVNRATFYKHYDNKDVLLNAVENDLLNNFKELTDKAPDLLLNQNINQNQLNNYYHKLVMYIYQHGKKFILLMNPKCDPSFNNKLLETDKEIWQRKNLLDNLSIPQRYASAGLMGMATNLITEWVKSNFHESPEEFMEILNKVFTPIFSGNFIFSKNDQ